MDKINYDVLEYIIQEHLNCSLTREKSVLDYLNLEATKRNQKITGETESFVVYKFKPYMFGDDILKPFTPSIDKNKGF
ncbi:TPA: hypothetical protein SB288_001435 [Campylobacter coli]|nr:hypothetical protein [Campylobacter coli]